MTTKVYGQSDDLIEVEGDVTGEVGYICSRDEDQDPGCLLVFNDGTMLAVKYGKPQGGIWAVTVVQQGPLFDRVEICTDDEAKPYSDVAYLKDGAKRVFSCKEWELVR